MAWRDSRRNRSRLLLFISSIVLGIAALVAIYSFGDSMKKNIDLQAASLLGADLAVYSDKNPDAGVRKFLDSLGTVRSEEQTFASMVFFPKSGGSRLTQVKALGGDFPYYGTLETQPATAATAFRKGRMALVDRTLMMQFNVRTGDSVQVGNVTFQVAGAFVQGPGQRGISTLVAPAVYIPLAWLPLTGLSQRGSRISYSFYYHFNRPELVEKTMDKLDTALEQNNLSYDTVESQKRDTGRAFQDLTRFLSLVGFIALLLGCVGVASAIHIYVREKLPSVAILRCLGVKAREAFLIYLLQIAGIGLVGSVIGALAGTVVQQFLPWVLADFLPLDVPSAISWPSIAQGIVLGVIISVLFALLPLLSIRKISPLNTLRVSETTLPTFRDPYKMGVYGLIVLFIVSFSFVQLGKINSALAFTFAVLLAFLLLCGSAWGLIRLVKRFFPSSAGYLWRQGLSNLFRPNNQTLILVVSIGLGSGFISTLFLVQDLLVNSVSFSAAGKQPNMMLFDIQSDQKDGVAAIATRHHLPLIQQVPIVTMNIESINGKTSSDIKEDSPGNGNRPPGPRKGPSKRLFRAELRASYRDRLISSETLTDGEWKAKPDEDGTVWISLEGAFARRNGIHMGDTLVMNVQGARITTRVGSFRKVSWTRVQTNFRVLFPQGVLEDAPQFHVLVTRVPSAKESAVFQQDMVRHFPTVSVVDLGLILSVLDKLIDKIGLVIRFMAGFSIVTGLVVLISSVLISKFQRIRESVLLRTLGATRKQVLAIVAIEYLFLGTLASASGILLSLAGSWALAHFSFEIDFVPRVWPLVLLFLAITGVVIGIGLLNSREVLNKSPLQVLSND